MRLVAELILILVAFGVGHYTALYPEDTRSFLERVRAAAGRLIHRKP